MKKVSVIIPVYNAENTVARCVESILYGNYSNVEILLIDDCSKDLSWEICSNLSIKYPNVIAIQNTRNMGVSYTRNKGISMATGDYVMFVDSDDWVSCNYLSTFCSLFKDNENSLVLSGFYYFNLTTNSKINYIWSENNKISNLYKPNLFSLKNKLILNSLWNKIFLNDHIKRYNIKFNENQSMGEDLDFILQYIENAKIKNYIIVNLPLYYYTYSNKETLMSNYGWSPIDFSIQNIKKIGKICKEEYCIEDIDEIEENDIKRLKTNYFYQILNNKNHTFKSKQERLKSLVTSNDDLLSLKQQKKIYFKNKVADLICFFKKVLLKIKSIFNSLCLRYKIQSNNRKYKNNDVSIISQNCIGGVFYHDMNLKFLSPTINLYLTSKDFMKFVTNLEYYIHKDIVIKWKEQYPIGIIDDITINFMHYNSCTEAYEQWEKRKKRINYDKIFVICTDMENFDEDCWSKWRKIKFPKLLFTANKKYVDENSVYFKKYEQQGSVGNLIPKREFYKQGKLIKMINDMKNN